MGRKQKTYHYIYKTTNLINGKYYIGMHSTNNLDDGYIGSGTRLWYSIKKYGKENFKLEILEFFENRFSLKEREKELVNEDLLKDKMCLNLKTGGEGGFSCEEHQKKCSKMGTLMMSLKMNNDEIFKKNVALKISKIRLEQWKNGLYLKRKKQDWWKSKNHSEDTKEKMRKSKNNGEKNSQYGTMWITNGIENLKIKKEIEIPQGWYKGRCFK